MQHAGENLYWLVPARPLEFEVKLLAWDRHFQPGQPRLGAAFDLLTEEGQQGDLVAAAQSDFPSGASQIDFIDEQLALPQREADAQLWMAWPVSQAPRRQRLVARC